ncbi:cation channel sperm-associated targeting subunit tau [Elgaria multicarinata webbii]|uniref:cation channel sperm-associated targeting subunit tau n=1 Tax=Elgaria multicarinata webbii TaxID=159646 RepID=UPI002FCD1C42
MKCTNPQVYRAHVKSSKRTNAIYFGDVRYFSVKVPKRKSDPRNRIVLELVSFEGPKDFPRLFGNVTMHLYEVIQKQSFTEICAMRIRNMVFCTVEVEFMFCYGSLGYGYSHQLKLPGVDPAKAVEYSMFLRVPPPEDRKDATSNVIKPQRMDYPAFLSPDLNVTVGNVELDSPKESSEHFRSLQRALKQPPQERLERMKNEYRNLKTWREKADYLDQLILKRGPKITPGQTKVSRFREIVGRIHHPLVQQNTISSTGLVNIHVFIFISWVEGGRETVIKEEEKPAEIQLDSVDEPVEQWPWKLVGFQEAVFSRNKFEPFLRRVCKVQPPPFRTGKGDVFSHLEKKISATDIKEQEDQDPPHELSLTKANSYSDYRPIKSGEQLSILRLIEKKMDLEDEDQKPAMQDKDELPGFSQKRSGDKLSEAETKEVQIYFQKSLETVLVDKLVKVVALKSLLSDNIENLVVKRLSETEISQELEDSNLPSDREKHLSKERKPSSSEKISESDLRKLKDVVSENLQTRLIKKLSEQGIIPDMELAEKDQKVSLPSSSDSFERRKSLFEETEIFTLKSLSSSQLGNISKTESKQHSKESSHEKQPIVTEKGFSESKIDSDRESILPVKSQDGSTDLRHEHSKQSLEIIRVTLPLSTETDIKQQLASHDILLERVLKAEITSLKTFLSKGLQDHLKDKLTETGLSTEDFETVCRKLSLNMKREHTKESLAEETPALSESVQNLFEALSESEIANLKFALNKKIYDHLSERLSEIGLITEEELSKILEKWFPVVMKETSPTAVKASDLPNEGQSVHSPSSLTQNLQDRFSDEELQNLKCLLSRLLKEGQRHKLSESEVKGLTSVFQKSSVNLSNQSSSETGISKGVEIKDKCHSLITLPSGEERSEVSNVAVFDSEKSRSKESLHEISTGEKYRVRGENPDHAENSIFEVETKNQETQTMYLTKKAKHSSKRECHRLPGYPENLEMLNLRRGSFEAGLKSKPPDEPSKRISEPFAFSSFLSAHDIGIQTEIKNYLSKPPNYLSKPSFPVNPETFRFLHSESEEEAKPASKHHEKSKSRRKTDKKDTVSHHPQQTMTHTHNKKERTNNGNVAKECLKCKKHGEPPPSKISTTENKKDLKTIASSTGVGKESLKQKAEKKRDNEVKPKKSLSKTAALSDPQLQNRSKNLQEKSSATTIPPYGRTKGNTLTLAGTEDLDVEAFKHLEKAIERALIDLGGVSESSSSHGRPSTVPSAVALASKDSSRPFSSAVETPKNQAGLISEMLNNQERILKMTPEQLAIVLRVLQKVLKQNTSPK